MAKTKTAKKRRNQGADVSVCSLPSAPPSKNKENRAAFYSHRGGFRWKGVRDESYKQGTGDWARIVRRVLVGCRGESTRFHVRYFEISSGGNSSFECHRHEHVVICVRGCGVVRTGRTRRKMDFMDTVYIAPDVPHQLSNPHREPFGFLCIVNAKRDRPRILAD